MTRTTALPRARIDAPDVRMRQVALPSPAFLAGVGWACLRVSRSLKGDRRARVMAWPTSSTPALPGQRWLEDAGREVGGRVWVRWICIRAVQR